MRQASLPPPLEGISEHDEEERKHKEASSSSQQISASNITNRDMMDHSPKDINKAVAPPRETRSSNLTAVRRNMSDNEPDGHKAKTQRNGTPDACAESVGSGNSCNKSNNDTSKKKLKFDRPKSIRRANGKSPKSGSQYTHTSKEVPSS